MKYVKKRLIWKRTLLLKSSEISFLTSEENKERTNVYGPSIIVDLFFDAIPEKDYEIGGRTYEEGRARFERIRR